jgi:hypothetical protein
VDSTPGCKNLSFLDCYSGYHQIPLKVKNEIKIVFIIPFGAFCYAKMSFGVKSVGAMYQRGIEKYYIVNLGKTPEHTFMIGSSRLRKMKESSLTWQRPSTT